MTEQISFEQTVTYSLARLTTAFRNTLEDHMGRVDLHGGQIFILMELWKEDGLRQVDIAHRLELRAPTINKMIRGLTEINLVVMRKSRDDGRASRIHLTDRGRAMRARVNDQWVELEAEYLAGLSETERLILPELLSKLRRAYSGRPTADIEPD